MIIDDFRKNENNHMFALTSRSAKRDVVRSNVMAQYVLFTKVMTLTLTFIRFSQKTRGLSA